jgi:hypothetical protein
MNREGSPKVCFGVIPENKRDKLAVLKKTIFSTGLPGGGRGDVAENLHLIPHAYQGRTIKTVAEKILASIPQEQKSPSQLLEQTFEGLLFREDTYLIGPGNIGHGQSFRTGFNRPNHPPLPD